MNGRNLTVGAVVWRDDEEGGWVKLLRLQVDDEKGSGNSFRTNKMQIE